MSIVISSIPCAGLIEMPPVSKTTPLPTIAKGAWSPPPCQRMTTTLEGLSEPCPTASSARIPRRVSSSSSSTSTSRPSSRIASRRSAKSVVVRTLAGSFTRSRVKNTPSASAAPDCASRAQDSGSSHRTVTRAFSGWGGSAGRSIGSSAGAGSTAPASLRRASGAVPWVTLCGSAAGTSSAGCGSSVWGADL